MRCDNESPFRPGALLSFQTPERMTPLSVDPKAIVFEFGVLFRERAISMVVMVACFLMKVELHCQSPELSVPHSR